MTDFRNGTDFNGTALTIGDKVVFIPSGDKELANGVITGFTAKMIEIEWKVGLGYYKGTTEKTFRNPNWVVKAAV